VLWGVLILLSAHIWSEGRIRPPVLGSTDHFVWKREGLTHSLNTCVPAIGDAFRNLSLLDQISGVASGVLFVALLALLPFFILLPFGARPGPNKPCVRHVARTVLLGFGTVHLWGVALVAAFWLRIAFPGDIAIPNYLRILTPLLFALTGMGLWSWVTLIRIVRMDYRGTHDFPEPHDPWCDQCGYNLVAADTQGRCPECGRPVLDSIGSHTRQPTAWEVRPSLLNYRAILGQLRQLITRPRTLFFSMPTLTGHAAAQRWLIFSLAVTAIVALPIVPAMARVLGAEWSIDLVSGSLAMALVWAVFACMMVGIETAGIATFSRMRGHGVYLSTAAKVTCYSSILLAVWVLCGGLQLVAFTLWNEQLLLAPMRRGSVRTHQIILAAALALPHMVGLLWYELTVYRGIRGVQYANK
jgi:hypothetical protein